MNRFSVHHNYATNDSVTKAGNVTRICNILLLLMTVCWQSSSHNYTKKEKKNHYFVREGLDFTSQGSFLQEK